MVDVQLDITTIYANRLTKKFDFAIRNPHSIIQTEYNVKIDNQVKIIVQNIKNPYIQTTQEIIQCLQFFLILCAGDNIKVEKIRAIDYSDRDIQIIKKWMKVYGENELLMVNFIKLQTTEDL